jgi:hypothetical protein
MSAAIADTDVKATRAVDARRILRMLNLPKDYVAGIGNTLKILKNAKSAINKSKLFKL